MLIRPFLPGQAFDPDVISEMSEALKEACDELGLHHIADAATRLVVEKIIRLAQRGIRGEPAALWFACSRHSEPCACGSQHRRQALLAPRIHPKACEFR